MKHYFPEPELNRVGGALIHTALGSGLARPERRYLMRLANKFRPTPVTVEKDEEGNEVATPQGPRGREVWLKPKDAESVRRIVAGYVSYMRAQEVKPESAEQHAQAIEALESAARRVSAN